MFNQTSADKPVTGPDGTFKVSFAQLYRGSLQLGLVTVSVTGIRRRTRPARSSW